MLLTSLSSVLFLLQGSHHGWASETTRRISEGFLVVYQGRDPRNKVEEHYWNGIKDILSDY